MRFAPVVLGLRKRIRDEVRIRQEVVATKKKKKKQRSERSGKDGNDHVDTREQIMGAHHHDDDDDEKLSRLDPKNFLPLAHVAMILRGLGSVLQQFIGNVVQEANVQHHW